MTVKMYENDSYLKAFDARVLDCRQAEDGYQVLLDQTAFFPEGGGQDADGGVLGGYKILDVQEQDGEIWHKIEGPLEKDSQVYGEIDWEVRFDRMQQHSGEHIVSGIVHTMLGYDNVGFHLGDEIVTMDYDGEIDAKTLQDIEIAANKAVYANGSIIVTYPDENALKCLNYRSKKEIPGQIRIVTVEGIDVCACCAPHVARTGEIGQIKILSCQKYKGGVRMSIACGLRALKDHQIKQTNASAISVLLSAKIDQVAQAVEKMHQDNQTLKYQLSGAKESLILANLKALEQEPGNVCLFVEGVENGPMRKAVNSLMEQREDLCAVFDGNDESGYKFLIGSAKKQARDVLNLMKETFTIRGGGSPEMVQGQIIGPKARIESVFKGLYAKD